MKQRTNIAILAVVSLMLMGFSCGGPSGKITIPDTPEGTVDTVAKTLADGHPEVLWMALPPSYQQDITEVTHAFANKVDADLYNKVFGLAGKAVTVLTDKRDIILGSSMLDMAGEDRVKIEQGYDTAMAFLGTLLTSEVSDLEKMKTIDYQAFLNGTGTALMEQAAAMSANNPEDPYTNEFKNKLEAMTIEVKENAGGNATLVVSAPEEDPEEIQLTQVEGRWVPKDLADDWAKNIAEVKQNIEEMTPEKMAETKMQAMMGLAMAESFIEQIGQVGSSEELDAMLGGMFGGLLGGMGAMPEEPTEPEDG